MNGSTRPPGMLRVPERLARVEAIHFSGPLSMEMRSFIFPQTSGCSALLGTLRPTRLPQFRARRFVRMSSKTNTGYGFSLCQTTVKVPANGIPEKLKPWIEIAREFRAAKLEMTMAQKRKRIRRGDTISAFRLCNRARTHLRNNSDSACFEILKGRACRLRGIKIPFIFSD